jgi:hypothetical protein
MEIPIEFIHARPGDAWMSTDRGHVVSFFTDHTFTYAIIILERNGQFVTSLLQNFKRV